MKVNWMWAVAGFVVAGAAAFLLEKKLKQQLLAFLPETEEQKNFGAFPPEIPAYEFEGIDFV
ncbi:MAG: hypothetical protein HY562_09130 [Ignavibacteriales bacterium]|nr:hypothetical protein [Ignavibacteriales bacterium]